MAETALPSACRLLRDTTMASPLSCAFGAMARCHLERKMAGNPPHSVRTLRAGAQPDLIKLLRHVRTDIGRGQQFRLEVPQRGSELLQKLRLSVDKSRVAGQSLLEDFLLAIPCAVHTQHHASEPRLRYRGL
jgi:hypothetical protein